MFALMLANLRLEGEDNLAFLEERFPNICDPNCLRMGI